MTFKETENEWDKSQGLKQILFDIYDEIQNINTRMAFIAETLTKGVDNEYDSAQYEFVFQEIPEETRRVSLHEKFCR